MNSSQIIAGSGAVSSSLPTVGPTHFQPEWGMALFTDHPVLFDMDFDTLIEEDPCLSAVELSMEDGGLPPEETAFPHPHPQ